MHRRRRKGGDPAEAVGRPLAGARPLPIPLLPLEDLVVGNGSHVGAAGEQRELHGDDHARGLGHRDGGHRGRGPRLVRPNSSALALPRRGGEPTTRCVWSTGARARPERLGPVGRSPRAVLHGRGAVRGLAAGTGGRVPGWVPDRGSPAASGLRALPDPPVRGRRPRCRARHLPLGRGCAGGRS